MAAPMASVLKALLAAQTVVRVSNLGKLLGHVSPLESSLMMTTKAVVVALPPCQ